jgi:hypothetical protein
MKHLLLFTLLLIGVNGFSQYELPIDSSTGKFTFETIESVELSKSEIYKRTKLWAAVTFKDSKEVIKFDDLESGKIIIKFIESHKFGPVYGDYYKTLTINIKHNKYKLVLTDFNSVQGNYSLEYSLIKKNGDYRTNNMYVELATSIKEKASSLFLDFKNSIIKDVDDDW